MNKEKVEIMKVFTTIMVIFLIIFCFSPVFAEEEIMVAIGEWSPFISRELPHYGIVSHIISEAFSESQIEVKYGFFPWNRSYRLVKRGEWHASAIWGKTEERKNDFYFSDIIYTGEDVLFYLKDRPVNWQGDLNDLSELKGLTIGLSLGSSIGNVMKKAKKKGLLTYDTTSDKLATFRKLLAKRVDAVEEIKTVGFHIIRTNFSKDQQERILNTDTLEKWDYHLLFSKKIDENKRYLEIFNKGLGKMKKDGRYTEMWADFYNGKYAQQDKID